MVEEFMTEMIFLGPKRSLLHSFSTNDARLGEYKYTITLGNDTVKITGTNHETVRVSILK